MWVVSSFFSTGCRPITCHSFNVGDIFEGMRLFIKVDQWYKYIWIYLANIQMPMPMFSVQPAGPSCEKGNGDMKLAKLM